MSIFSTSNQSGTHSGVQGPTGQGGGDYFTESAIEAEIAKVMKEFNKLITSFNEQQTAFTKIMVASANASAKDISWSGVIQASESIGSAVASGAGAAQIGSVGKQTMTDFADKENALQPIRTERQSLDEKIDYKNHELNANAFLKSNEPGQTIDINSFKNKMLSFEERKQLQADKKNLIDQRKALADKEKEVTDRFQNKAELRQVELQKINTMTNLGNTLPRSAEAINGSMQADQKNQDANKDVASSMNNAAQNVEQQVQKGVDDILRIDVFAAARAASARV